ncbi:major facilitator superfamily domain-containing protein [Phascolomyces articulosus]|uniref:Major facilitator superfamily domain-containing protein n=1 Tax=Phascolomyces articulosus TaxID=60185 RepID=A0AAD5PFQ5_9FUNG|nr:major facilitator superfamily domain-containing protein [Phascolomyces articulosus]
MSPHSSSSSSSNQDIVDLEKDKNTGIRIVHDEKTSEYVPPDDKEIKRLMWKLDLRIVPLVAMLYLCSFLDRVNIGHAKLAGIMDDLHISESLYMWSLSIFFVGYVIFEVPANMFLKWIGPRKWIALIMVVWGTVMCAMAAVTNGEGLMASRFFLGISEGVIFLITVWYPRKTQTIRMAIFYAASTLAGAFGGVLAYGIMHLDGRQGLAGWQWIFILESLPTFVFAIVTFFYLPDYPENSPFLNKREREIVVHRIKEDVGPATETHFSWKQFFAAFTDIKLYMISIMSLCCCCPMYSLSLFMPTIVRDMGFQNLTAQAMSAPPADKRTERGYHYAGVSFLGMVGYILLITLRDQGAAAKYVSATVATCGAFPLIPLTSVWNSNNTGGHTKRAVAIAVGAAVGNAGGIISAYLAYENKRRDKLTPEQYRIECEGEELCDKHPDYRYIL